MKKEQVQIANNIDVLYDYIKGKKFTDKIAKEPFRTDEAFMLHIAELQSKFISIAVNINVSASPAILFAADKELSLHLEPHQYEEAFYIWKLGYACKEAPAKLVWMLQETLNEYGSLNQIYKTFGNTYLNEIFQEGYLTKNVTLETVIKQLFVGNYEPLSTVNNKVRNRTFWDLYIQDTGRVAIVTEEIAKRLSQEDVDAIKLERGKLRLEGEPISTLGTHIGAVNSIYDLRRVI